MTIGAGAMVMIGFRVTFGIGDMFMVWLEWMGMSASAVLLVDAVAESNSSMSCMDVSVFVLPGNSLLTYDRFFQNFIRLR